MVQLGSVGVGLWDSRLTVEGASSGLQVFGCWVLRVSSSRRGDVEIMSGSTLADIGCGASMADHWMEKGTVRVPKQPCRPALSVKKEMSGVWLAAGRILESANPKECEARLAST